MNWYYLVGLIGMFVTGFRLGQRYEYIRLQRDAKQWIQQFTVLRREDEIPDES